MFKGNFYKIIKQGMSALLCGGLLFSQPGIIYASENTAAQVTAAPEHSSTYSQAADTDSRLLPTALRPEALPFMQNPGRSLL